MKKSMHYLIIMALFLSAGVFVWAGSGDRYDPVAITATATVGPYPGTVAADELDFTWTAAEITAASCSSFISTGKEILLVRNPGVASATFALHSQLDQFQRSGDIEYTLAAGEYAQFAFTATLGWKNATGAIHITSSTSDVEFAVLRLP